jgi:hypothetical protein
VEATGDIKRYNIERLCESGRQYCGSYQSFTELRFDW